MYRQPLNIRRFARCVLLCFAAGLLVPLAIAEDPTVHLDALAQYPHAALVSQSKVDVIDREIGLGMLKKVRGQWEFKASERVTGHLQTYTWQITDGFNASEVYEQLLKDISADHNARLLFNCEGRACGRSAQWANRVFGERVLYGREDLQSYSVFAVEATAEYRLVVYSSARTLDRQHLHVELLQLLGEVGESSD